MSGGAASRAAAVTVLGLVVGCASRPGTRPSFEHGCQLHEIAAASLIEDVNRFSSRHQIALANPADGDLRLGGALYECTPKSVAFALSRLGIQTVERNSIPLAHLERHDGSALQQDGPE
jgi:hypothetical protein